MKFRSLSTIPLGVTRGGEDVDGGGVAVALHAERVVRAPDNPQDGGLAADQALHPQRLDLRHLRQAVNLFSALFDLCADLY